jgi:hypothetical protein
VFFAAPRVGFDVRTRLVWALASSSALLAQLAAADAVDGPPLICPPGMRGYSSHGGPGCAPPRPTDCPAGYEPMVVNDVAYCDPPHASACPTGSSESSRGPNEPYCELRRSCTPEEEPCWPGSTCRASGLCIDPSARYYSRFADYRVYGACETDADCPAGKSCDHTPRCDPTVHRVDPQGRTLPAIVKPPPWRPWAIGCGAVVVLVPIALAAFFVLRRGRRPVRS